jgi:transketolase
MLEVSRDTDAHIPSALSILEITWTLHDRVMSPNCKYVLSKGHGALALYVTLEHKGLLPKVWLDRFCKDGAELLGHPERDAKRGIHCTTGSLAHGAPMAAGMALAKRIKGEAGRIFCVVGDGEAEEGALLETLHIASRLKLSNLIFLIDANGTSPNGIDGKPYESSLVEKFSAFGWFVSRIDGHDCGAIELACKAVGGDKPYCIICNTTKGRGVSEMEADPQAWHRRMPTSAMIARL